MPTTHISAGSDCEFGQKARIEFNVDARGPTTFVLALRGMASPSLAHPCEYVYVRFPGHIGSAYAYALSGPTMTTEVKENIYEHGPGSEPRPGNAFTDGSSGGDAKFTVAIRKLPEPVQKGELYVKGELDLFLSASSFTDRALHYWVRLPGSRIRNGCQTEAECEDDYLADNPHAGSINLIFARNLSVKSVLIEKSARALTKGGLTRITTENLTGSVLVEDTENARLRDVILLYASALFATGIAVGTDGVIELIRFALGSRGSRDANRRQ